MVSLTDALCSPLADDHLTGMMTVEFECLLGSGAAEPLRLAGRSCDAPVPQVGTPI